MQTDLVKQSEQQGIIQFMDIIKNMDSFDMIDFSEEGHCTKRFSKRIYHSKRARVYKGMFESIDRKMSQLNV